MLTPKTDRAKRSPATRTVVGLARQGPPIPERRLGDSWAGRPVRAANPAMCFIFGYGTGGAK